MGAFLTALARGLFREDLFEGNFLIDGRSLVLLDLGLVRRETDPERNILKMWGTVMDGDLAAFRDYFVLGGWVAEPERFDFDELCGTAQRPCPKSDHAILLDGAYVPPPCIYIMPDRSANNTEWNWDGRLRRRFPEVLLKLFALDHKHSRIRFRKHARQIVDRSRPRRCFENPLAVCRLTIRLRE